MSKSVHDRLGASLGRAEDVLDKVDQTKRKARTRPFKELIELIRELMRTAISVTPYSDTEIGVLMELGEDTEDAVGMRTQVDFCTDVDADLVIAYKWYDFPTEDLDEYEEPREFWTKYYTLHPTFEELGILFRLLSMGRSVEIHEATTSLE